MVGFFDALQVAPLGDDALAAASTGALNSFIAVILPMGMAFIVQSFASQLRGRDDMVRARRYAWYGLAIAAMAALLSIALIPFVGPLLSNFDYTPTVRQLQTEYLNVRLTSVAAIVGTEALGNWFSGIGNTRYHMRAGLIAMVANIPLNWIFIGGHLGAPALGVAGAALASSIASWLAFFYMVWAFRRFPEGRTTGALGLRWDELWRVMRFGFPNGVNWFLEFGAFSFFINSVMASLGTLPLAALNVVISISSVAFMPAFGVASAGAILVGQHIGAKQLDAVPGILKLTAKVTITWMGTIGLIYVIFPRPIFSLFVSQKDPVDAAAFLGLGATMLALSTSWQVFDAASMTLSESLRATGDTSWCLRARLVLAWFVFVPVSWLSVIKLGGGVVAAIACFAGYMALLAAAFAWRFRSGKWREIKLVEELPAEALT